MRAVVCRRLGPPETLEVADVPAPSPAPGEALVDVHGCGVNFPDTLIIEGRYQFKPELPFSPGSEIAGTVAALGDGADGVAVGDRVMGMLGWGGFAEQVAAPASALVPVPDEMDLVTASGFTLAYATSYHALVDRGRLQEGETLLVLGAAGGVGLAAVQLGAALGARVIAAASTDAKLALCREHGAAETVNYATEDLRGRLKELTGGRGADVVYDPVGGALSEPALRSIAWRGRFLVVGFAAGDIPRIPLNLTLLKGCEIVGVFAGAFMERQPEDAARNAAALNDLWSSGRIRPVVSATYPLEEAARALQDIAARTVTGKVVVTTERGRAAAGPA
jgi:NADPH2:quinone reductase